MSASTRLTLWMACFVTGIALGSSYQTQPTWYVWLFVIIFSIIGFRKRLAILLIAGGFFLGSLYVAAWRSNVTLPWQAGQFSTLTGTVVASPDRRATKTLLTVEPKGSTARVLVSADRYPLIAYGDELRISGVIQKPEAFSGFNYHRGSPLLAALYRLQNFIESSVQKNIPEPESAFLNGIMLGSKRAVPADLTQDLQNTGTSHIIAISGANITILLDIVLQLLPFYTLRRQFWATVAIATFVTLLTGASASVVRGALIASVSRWARLHSRRAWVLPLILSCMLIMLLFSPLLLVADPGFQLSFAAFAGLGWLGTPCKNYVNNHRIFSRWPEAVRGALAETTAASLGTAPVSFSVFGQLSLLGLVVNPLVLWPLPAITLMGLIICIFGWLPPVVALIQFPLWLSLHFILGIISWFGNLDIGLIHWQPRWLISLGLWVFVALLILFIRKLPRYAPP